MRGKFQTATNSKEKMIRAAADLFHEQGVHRTTPREVVKAAALTINQFYHHFANKQGLVHEVLRAYHDAIMDTDGPVNSIDYHIASWADLEKWFFAHLELQKRFRMTRGCPFGTVGNELTGQKGPVREDLSQIFDLVKTKLKAFFEAEKRERRLSKNADEELLADFCIATVQGAMLLGKVKQNSKPVEGAFREALTHLKHYSIVANKK